jgi:hypothetical protein
MIAFVAVARHQEAELVYFPWQWCGNTIQPIEMGSEEITTLHDEPVLSAAKQRMI